MSLRLTLEDPHNRREIEGQDVPGEGPIKDQRVCFFHLSRPIKPVAMVSATQPVVQTVGRLLK